MLSSLTKVVIIIPTYNEAEVIQETILQLFALTETIEDKECHLLIFDSASTDQTQMIVRALQSTYSKLHLRVEPQKTGLGSAYLQAMSFALNQLNADIIVEFDADLSHQPSYLPSMLQQMNQYDVVVGSRYVPGGAIPEDWGWHRKLLSRVGNMIAKGMLSRRYQDWTSGFRMTSRSALIKALPNQFISNGYAYKLELFWRLYQQGAKILEYPIMFIDRGKGQSKLPKNTMVDSLRVLGLLRLQKSHPFFKMCLVGGMGMFLQCLIYALLRQRFSVASAAQLAVMIAILHNFIFNHQFTFRQKLRQGSFKKLKLLINFTLYSLCMTYFQSHWAEIATHYFGYGPIKEGAIVLTGIVSGAFLNYTIYSRVFWNHSNMPDIAFDA